MRKQVEWLYRPAKVNIEDYREDLTRLKQDLMPDLDKFYDTHFIPVSHDDLRKNCPNIIKLIQSWDLEDRMAEDALILVKPNKKYAIHRDFARWKARNIALNFPVANCEDSYTAFYEAEILPKETMSGTLGENVYVSHALAVNNETAREIGRCDSTIPHWINVYVPHAPVVNHDRVRIALSIRFQPELFDYIASGRFDREMAV
jgi:hypothetical protein